MPCHSIVEGEYIRTSLCGLNVAFQAIVLQLCPLWCCRIARARTTKPRSSCTYFCCKMQHILRTLLNSLYLAKQVVYFRGIVMSSLEQPCYRPSMWCSQRAAMIPAHPRSSSARACYDTAAPLLAHNKIVFLRMQYLRDATMPMLICPPCNASMSC